MKNKSLIIKEYFDDVCKDAKCTLDYFSDYSLLIAIMLSAQCTDAKVNKVTAKLFKENKTLEDLEKLSLRDIENYLMELGLYKNKAKYLKELVNILINKFSGTVPKNKELLVKMPGIGNKTANVFLAEYYKIPQFPVDTHVNRVAKRLGLVDQDSSVLDVEKTLRNLYEKNDWIDLHHKFIFFGRNYCRAIVPKCENCKLKKYCNFKWFFL